MSSGFGLNGGRGRCFPFWQELVKCHVQTSDSISPCVEYFKDYQECLTHAKEKKRLQMIAQEVQKQKSLSTAVSKA